MPPSDEEVRQVVRRVLARVAGTTGTAGADQNTQLNVPSRPDRASESMTVASRPPRDNRPVLVDEAVMRAQPAGTAFAVPRGALVTPLARQAALDLRITLVEANTPAYAESRAPVQRRIAVGADHGGYPLKEALKPHLQSLGYEVIDCGTHSTDAVDYPDIALAVAELVANGKCAGGVIIDGAGIGSCMVANKVPGVRAALCYDHATAVNSREHNHANVLTLGAGLIGASLAKQIVTDWLATPYGAGRHAKRVEKIVAIEKRFSKG